LSSPRCLAHGPLISPDLAAASLGVGAAWLFWKWLRIRSWKAVLWAAVLLGLAELCKSTWIVLFALWPAIWAAWRLSDRSLRRNASEQPGDTRSPVPLIAAWRRRLIVDSAQ